MGELLLPRREHGSWLSLCWYCFPHPDISVISDLVAVVMSLQEVCIALYLSIVSFALSAGRESLESTSTCFSGSPQSHTGLALVLCSHPPPTAWAAGTGTAALLRMHRPVPTRVVPLPGEAQGFAVISGCAAEVRTCFHC